MGGTAAVITAIAAIGGAGASIYKAEQEADAREDARDELKREARRDAEILRENKQKLISRQRAKFAASGVRVDQDTPLAVIEETRKEADEEIEERLRVAGYRGDVLSTEARNLRITGLATAGGTLLKGAGDYARNPYATNPFK